ncbi:MAG: hypothetical protein LBK82_13920 [Planctomycetaceae bacterium]|nr:hypothetical protein [Planctomycetaceae bacterium]
MESNCQPKTGAKSALPTQPFSERLPTSWLPIFNENSVEILPIYFTIPAGNT